MSGEHISALARALRDGGVETVFGVAGGGASYSLIEELRARGARFFPAAHEAAAAMMAGAACRMGSTRAAAVSIKGPGVANLIAGIVSNAYEMRPAVTVSEAYPPGAPAASAHKRLDHGGLMRVVAKGVAWAEASASGIGDLLACASREVPGPVHVELCAQPVSAASWCVEADTGASSDDGLSALVERVAAASRPAFVLGSACSRSSSAPWAEALVPVATTAAAKGCIDESSAFAAGVVTGETGELSPESGVLSRADLIVGVGLRNTEMVRNGAWNAPVVIVDAVGGAVHEGVGAEAVVTVSDLGAAAGRLVSAAAGASWGAAEIEARRVRIAVLADGGWTPAAAFAAMAGVPEDTVLVPDTGLFCVAAETVWRARDPWSFCGSSVGRFMGTSVPTAIGIAASERRPVACVAGDGGIRPYFPELRLAVEERLPMLVVLMSDGRYGTLAAADPAARGGNRAVAIGERSWAAAAEAIGMETARAADAAAVASAVASWAAEPRPFFLETSFEPDVYLASVGGLR